AAASPGRWCEHQKQQNCACGLAFEFVRHGLNDLLAKLFGYTYSTQYLPSWYPVTTSTSRTLRPAGKSGSSSMNTTRSMASAISDRCGALVASATRLSRRTRPLTASLA